MIKYEYPKWIAEQFSASAEEQSALVARLGDLAGMMWNQDLVDFREGAAIEAERQPLDAAFMDLPDRLLEAYDGNREQSELKRILDTANRLRGEVDRVVVLGIGGSYMGARALMDACCHPWHNELNRAERGSWPRLYFEGNNVDNDSAQALLQLLERDSQAAFNDGRWAIVVISKSGGTIETASALRAFLRQMERQFGTAAVSQLVVPVTGPDGKLAKLSDELGCVDRFQVPEGVGGRFSVLSAVGLLPAALMGLDLIQLLRGAWVMNEHFRATPPAENGVIQYVAINHLAEQSGASIRILSAWAKSLESAGLWYDQLLAESIGKQELGVTPLTVVNTRDLHSRAQQHQEGARDKFINNLVVDSWRFDPLRIGHRQSDPDDLNRLAETSWPDLMEAAIAGTDKAYHDDRRPTATLRLPSTREYPMGQFFQMMMLATVLEGRLLGINPYGQPGVEMYKRNMQAILAQNRTASASAE